MIERVVSVIELVVSVIEPVESVIELVEIRSSGAETIENAQS